MHEPPRRPLISKIALTVVGTLLTLLGLIGVVLPVMPGLVFLIPGLAILAGEYAWARHLLDRARPRRLPRTGSTGRDDLAA